MNLCMAPRAQRQHQAQNGLSGHPVVHDDRALVPSRSVTDAATVAIALEDRFPQSSVVLLILTLERVAGCTQAKNQHLCVPARAMHYPLTASLHFPAPAAYR